MHTFMNRVRNYFIILLGAGLNIYKAAAIQLGAVSKIYVGRPKCIYDELYFHVAVDPAVDRCGPEYMPDGE